MVTVTNGILEEVCLEPGQESLKIPDGISGIRAWAFAGNRNLKEVWFPEHLCRIGSGAFRRIKPPAYAGG